MNLGSFFVVVVDMCSGNHFKDEYFLFVCFLLHGFTNCEIHFFSSFFFSFLFFFFSSHFFFFFFARCVQSAMLSQSESFLCLVCTAGVGIGLVYRFLMAHGKKH